MTTTAEPPFRASRYTTGAIILHWLIALIILGQIASGFIMMELLQQGSELQFDVYQLHKSFGVLVLVLTVARVLWRVFNPPPPEPDSVLPWERRVSHLVHMSFYALMIMIPLSGWVLITVAPIQIETVLFFQTWLPWPHVPGLGGLSPETQDVIYDASENVHAFLAYGAGFLAALHIAGALKHQLADGDFIQRMLPGGKGDGPRNSYGHATAWSAMVVFAVAMIGAAAVARMNPDIVAEAGVSPDQAEILTTGALPTGPTGDGAPDVWIRDPDVGSLTFTLEMSGETIMGSFGTFDTAIVFEPDDLDESSIVVTVDTGSATLPSNAITDSQLFGRDGFAIGDFPTARFESDSIRAEGEGEGYVADGTLTIRGTTIPQTLAFTVEIDGDRAGAAGEVAVDRFDYDIGTGSDGVGDTLMPAITIAFAIEADRAAPGTTAERPVSESTEALPDDQNEAASAAAGDTAEAPLWSMLADDSRLSFAFDLDGDDMVGVFEAFDATIRFDRDNLKGSSLDVTIDLASAAMETSGLAEFQLKGSDGLDVAGNATARFKADTIRAVDGGFEADGAVTLRGIETPVTLPFTLEVEDGIGRAIGEVVLNRETFGIAADATGGGADISEGVTVGVEITARAPNAAEVATAPSQ